MPILNAPQKELQIDTECGALQCLKANPQGHTFMYHTDGKHGKEKKKKIRVRSRQKEETHRVLELAEIT